MAETPGAVQYYPYPRGMVTNADPIQIPKINLQEAKNCVFMGTRDNPGGATPRSPLTRQNAWNTSTVSYYTVGSSTTADVIYYTDYWANVSNDKRQRTVAVKSDRRVYADNGNGQWTQDVTGSSVTLTSFALGEVTTEVMNEDMIFGFKNSTDSIVVWENQGSSATLVKLSSTTGIAGTSGSVFSGAKASWIVRQHQSRMWYAGNPAAPDTIYFSKPAFYNDFTVDTSTGSAGSIQIFPGDGDPEGITSIFPSINSQELYVAKRKKLYKIITSELDPLTWPVVKCSDEIGCVNHNTAKTIAQKDVFFESDLGIHSLLQVIQTTGIIVDTLVSFPISEDYRTMDGASKSQHSAVFWPEQNLYLHTAKTSGSSEINRIYCYDLETSDWSYWDTAAEYTVGSSTESVSFNFVALVTNASTLQKQLYIADNNAFVNFYNEDADADLENSSDTSTVGTPVLYRQVSAITFPQATWLRESAFTDFWILCRSFSDVNLRVYYRIDSQEQFQEDIEILAPGGNILGTTLLGSSTFFLGLTGRGIRPAYAALGGYGYGIEITIEHDTAGQSFEVYGIIIKSEDAEESRNLYGQAGEP